MKSGMPEEKYRYFYKRTKALRIFGFWPISHSKKSQFFYNCYVFFILTTELFAELLVFIATLNFALEQKEFNAEVCEQIILLCVTFQMIIKTVIIAFKAKYIQKLIEDLSDTMKKKFVTDEEDFEIMKKCREKDHKISKFFCILIFLVLLAALIKPLASMFKRMHNNYKSNITEPDDLIGELPSKYPFQFYEKSIWFPIIYTKQSYLSYLGACSTWAMDTMLCGFLNYLCGHFDILAKNIKNSKNEKGLSDNVMAKKFVQHHLYLINFAKELNHAFAPLIVMQLGLGAITIGLQMIQLILIKSASLFAYAKPITYLLLKSFTLYVFCSHGQMLWDRSIYIANACYDSLWYTKSRNWCICLKIIMMRSYRPIKVEVATLFEFSLERFRNVLNTAYSLFAVMQSVSPNSA